MDQPTSFWHALSQSGLFRAVRTSIRLKLLLGLLAVALIPIAALSTAVYFSADRAVMAKTTDQLEAVRSLKASQLQQYFQTLAGQISTFAENPMTVDALHEFQASFLSVIDENQATRQEIQDLRRQLRSYYDVDFSEEYRRRNAGKSPNVNDLFNSLGDAGILLQSQYLKNNPNPLGKKHLLDRAADRSTYSDQHAKYHPVLRSYLEKFGLYDIFLVDAQSGDVVYSCFKELDFATSLKEEPYSQTNLGRAFAKAAELDSSDSVAFLDYESYLPSFDETASFLASPIFDGNKKIGVAIFQIPISRVSAILDEKTGLGETGETIAVGPGGLLRNNSRFAEQLLKSDKLGRKTTIIHPDIRIDGAATTGALAGQSGTQIEVDYRGATVLTSWQPVAIHRADDTQPGCTWALLSKIDLAEVRQPVNRMFLTMLAIAALATAVVLIAGYALARNLTRQTDAITDMLGQIGIGDFDARADVLSEDELGTVAMSLNAMCDNTLSLIQTREERDSIQLAVQKLKEEVAIIASGDLTQEAEVTDELTGGIAESINHMIFQLRTIISNLHETVTQVTNSAGEIQKTTDRLSMGSDQQSAQIADTSTAIKDMAASIQLVSEHTEQSANVANLARESAVQGTKAVQNTMQGMERIRDQVQENAKRIKRLGESSQEVGEIVQLIGDIADRTSILALNASIQAAMAGDAGKGFAVVAEEVERLAERSNRATQQIETLIKAIQRETAEAITAMEQCTKEVVSGTKLASEAGYTLSEIDSVSKSLAELIQSISQSTRQQARTAEMLTKSMHDISSVTQQTAAGTKHASESVGILAELADALQSSVSAFRLPHLKPRSALVFDERENLGPVGSLILKALK